MRVRSISLADYSLPFCRPMSNARSAYRCRKGSILKLEVENNLFGLGEIAPLPGMSKESLEESLKQLKECRELLCSTDVQSPKEVEDLLEQSNPPLLPTLSFALETAFLDLLSQKEALPLHSFLNPESLPHVFSNALGDIQNLHPEDLLARGFKVVKCKLLDGSAHEAEQLRRLMDQSADLRFRIDANAAFPEEQILSFFSSENFNYNQIDYIEEPLKNPSPEKLEQLRQRIPDLSLALDESLGAAFSFRDALRCEALDVLVCKSALIGGYGKLVHLCDEAKAHKKNIVLSSLLESAVGLTAQIHFAAALGGKISSVCGLSTFEFFSNPLTRRHPWLLQNPHSLSSAPGLGTDPDQDLNFKSLF